MSNKYLGDTFDFHGGGSDLIFPHHENEIAQSEAYTGLKPMVKYWLHNGFITINSEKMSKSLNNFFLVKDVLALYSPDALRFFLISNHYRSPLDFSDERLNETTRSIERLGTSIDNVLELLKMPAGPKSAEAQQLLEDAHKNEEAFEDAMCDDFNTALASAAMFDLAKKVNIYKDAVMNTAVPVDPSVLSEVKRVFKMMTDILGILEERWEGQKANASSKDYDELMDAILEIRQECRAQKQYALADAIRDKLAVLGITIEDSPQGARWKK
jgi:cysteinyl-tRNA synthetase